MMMRWLRNHPQWVFSLMLLLTLGTGVAHADSGTETLTITAGNSTDNVNQNQDTVTLPVGLTDALSNGAGWNLQITSTQFTTGGDTPQTLPTTAATIASISASCTGSDTCILPANYPLIIPADSTAPTAVQITNSADFALDGLSNIAATIVVSTPENTAGGMYTSTITLTIAAAP